MCSRRRRARSGSLFGVTEDLSTQQGREKAIGLLQEQFKTADDETRRLIANVIAGIRGLADAVGAPSSSTGTAGISNTSITGVQQLTERSGALFIDLQRQSVQHLAAIERLIADGARSLAPSFALARTPLPVPALAPSASASLSAAFAGGAAVIQLTVAPSLHFHGEGGADPAFVASVRREVLALMPEILLQAGRQLDRTLRQSGRNTSS
jgi:hypothetical protein